MTHANQMRLFMKAPKWMHLIDRLSPTLGEFLGRRWLMKNQPPEGYYNLAPGGQFRATLTEPIDHSFDMPLTLRYGTVDIVDDDSTPDRIEVLERALRVASDRLERCYKTAHEQVFRGSPGIMLNELKSWVDEARKNLN